MDLSISHVMNVQQFLSYTTLLGTFSTCIKKKKIFIKKGIKNSFIISIYKQVKN